MRADYDKSKNEWFIESPIALSSIQKIKVVNYLQSVYAKRIKGEVGVRRQRMEEAVKRLSPQSLVVRLVGQEKLLYVDPNDKL